MIALKKKIRIIINYFKCYKNPVAAIRFRLGDFKKGKLVELFLRDGRSIKVARSGDFWILDALANGQEIVIETDYIIIDGIKLRMGTSDTFVYREIWIDRVYEMCIEKISQDAIIIDAGAHIGLFSLFCAPHCKQIIAVEALQKNFDLAMQNFNSSVYKEKITCLVYVLWSESNKLLQLDSKLSDLHTAEMHVLPESIGGKGICTITLRDLFQLQNVSHCDLLKMDIEGAEYEVLLSDIAILDHIRHICLEYHEDISGIHCVEELIKILKSKYSSVVIKSISSTSGLIFASRA